MRIQHDAAAALGMISIVPHFRPRARQWLRLLTLRLLTLLLLVVRLNDVVAENGAATNDCHVLDAAVTQALNMQIPPEQLAKFGGRRVPSWSASDFDAFLTTLSTCVGRLDDAPTLYAFPAEAEALLKSLRRRVALRDEGLVVPVVHAPRTAIQTGLNERQTSTDQTSRGNPPRSPITVRWRQGIALVANELTALERGEVSPQSAHEMLNTVFQQLENLNYEVIEFAPHSTKVEALGIINPLQDRANHINLRQSERAGTVDVAQASNPNDASPSPAPHPVASPPSSSNPPSSAPPISAQRGNELTSPRAATSTQVDSLSSGANASEAKHNNSLGLIIVTWLLTVVAGCFAGWKKKIVVFRDYNDLALVFFAALVLVIGFILMAGFADGSQSSGIAIVATTACAFLALCGIVVVRTWQDNRSLWAVPLALITKLSLAGLFLVSLAELISPGGKTLLERSRRRSFALGALVLLAPIVHGLVRDKKGIWAPLDVLGAARRGRMGI